MEPDQGLVLGEAAILLGLVKLRCHAQPGFHQRLHLGTAHIDGIIIAIAELQSDQRHQAAAEQQHDGQKPQ